MCEINLLDMKMNNNQEQEKPYVQQLREEIAKFKYFHKRPPLKSEYETITIGLRGCEKSASSFRNDMLKHFEHTADQKHQKYFKRLIKQGRQYIDVLEKD
jgi:hypothetical protein